MHKTKWKILSKTRPTDNIVETVLRSRGIKSSKDQEAFLSPSYTSGLADPFLLKDSKKAAKRIHSAVENSQKIAIYGDYDIDGLTATTLMADFLGSLGVEVFCYIPDRYEEGYGLNSNSIRKLKEEKVDLIITVDCGVTATKELAYAKELGVDVIVTDHHEPPDVLPKGQYCMLNPKLPGCKYPFKELAGVGVAFTLVRAFQKMYSAPELGKEKWLLDLVALGTVCDVVSLVGENRLLAHFGLLVMRKTPRVGLQELMQVSGVKLTEVSSADLGFRLGPRLNAAGRLEHARVALQLLQSTQKDQATAFALKLNELNTERQLQTNDIFMAADKLAKKHTQDMVLVLADSEWLHGVVGIVASRISEKYHKPTILLQINEKKAKGSARSYGTFSIIEAIRACSEELEKFGGHDFAAGMSLSSDAVDAFRYKINEYAKKTIDVSELVETLAIDAEIQNTDFSLETVDLLSRLEPFGRDNKEPLFVSKLELVMIRVIGAQQNHQKFTFLSSDQRSVDGIAFSSIHKWPDLELGVQYNVVFRLQKNEFRDVCSLQLEVVDLKINE